MIDAKRAPQVEFTDRNSPRPQRKAVTPGKFPLVGGLNVGMEFQEPQKAFPSRNRPSAIFSRQ